MTVEVDSGRAAIASRIFEGREDVTVIAGGWREIRAHAPFDMLFSDGGPKREPDAPTQLAQLVNVGGFVVLDDCTPESVWTPEQRLLWENDASRSIWLRNPDWIAAKPQVAPDMAVILATRTR